MKWKRGICKKIPYRRKADLVLGWADEPAIVGVWGGFRKKHWLHPIKEEICVN